MFPININLLQNEANQNGAKSQLVRANQNVFNALKLSLVNLVDSVTEAATYNAVHWISNVDRWLRNQNSTNTTSYKRGDIVFLDLGAQNFKHEPSYTHACIILANRFDSILVVPCSTKQYGTGHPGIIDATPQDGFIKNTGVQSENFRWVSKNRVVSNTGNKVSPAILNKLEGVLLSFSPATKNLIVQKDAKIKGQKDEIDDLRQQLKLANERIEKLTASSENN